MISIIIPTLNEEKAIESTILSLKDNLAIPYEIIISDGGSTDKTVEIARKYADKTLTHLGKKRQTIAEGRNAGAKVSRGEFLIFLDADCQLQNPNLFLNRALARFEADKNLVGLTTEILVFPEDETISDQFFFTLLNTYSRFMNNYLFIGECFGGEFQMMRTKAFKKVGGYRENLVCHEDSRMFNSLSKIGRTIFEPSLTVYHTGRRAHKIGWPKLLFSNFRDTIYDVVFHRSYSKVWEPIR